jgi:fermentation-respiration switch protein FrsA (DUF1100 family)
VAGERRTGGQGGAAVVAAVPVRLGPGATVGAARQLAWVLGEVEEGSPWHVVGRGWEFVAAVGLASADRMVGREEGAARRGEGSGT